MKRLGLRAKLLLAMFLIISLSIGLVASQAVLLFQQDKSSYVFDLNASRAIKISDEIQANVRHLTEKMRIFAEAARLASGSVVQAPAVRARGARPAGRGCARARGGGSRGGGRRPHGRRRPGPQPDRRIPPRAPVRRGR